MIIQVRPRDDDSERGYLLVRDMRKRSRKVYFSQEPTAVKRDLYINARLARGDLVLVKAKPTNAKKKEG